ncbi:hypothetical protein SVIO_004410 [Streptomyces violaceusniger]|uniref:Uncharacterized protein n=1 Tax=Streptomyces violaceusniger TaxID=68280 RepID=A0A4D4KTU7_STRVO|nr:hypothetical protein SVIO_004410 [Streptomyces violaceusniger]
MVLAFPRAFRGDILDPLTLVGLGARLIETATMPEAEVRQLLEERTDVGSAIRLAHRVHAITGGNPSLVTALAHDLVQAGGPRARGTPSRSARASGPPTSAGWSAIHTSPHASRLWPYSATTPTRAGRPGC